MTHALVTYYSHAGHTARIARVICETLQSKGAKCDLMEISEAAREGVEWEKYDLVIVGAAIIYGVYNKIVWEFIRRFQPQLEARANSFFNVTVVARTPYKATIEGNRYMQRFLQKSPWHPKDLKCIAGKVDYPNWNWYQKLAIQMIMKMTKGPTDPTAVIDYTDWDDVRAYAEHCLSLVDAPKSDAEKKPAKTAAKRPAKGQKEKSARKPRAKATQPLKAVQENADKPAETAVKQKNKTRKASKKTVSEKPAV